MFADSNRITVTEMSDTELSASYDNMMQTLKHTQGNENSIEVIHEMARRYNDLIRNREKSIVSGDTIYYVDDEDGSIEKGTVVSVLYSNNVLEEFSVDFECGDFDVFNGTAYGKCFFKDQKDAYSMITKHQQAIPNNVGCECCAGDTALYHTPSTDVFIDNKGNCLVGIDGLEDITFQVRYCPHCGRKF